MFQAQEKRAKEEEELRKFAEKQAENEKPASKGINWRDLKVRFIWFYIQYLLDTKTHSRTKAFRQSQNISYLCAI